MPSAELPRDSPDVQRPLERRRWLSDAAQQCILLSPFLITGAVIWLSWALYGASGFRAVPARELGQLLAAARISGPGETVAVISEYTAHLAWNTIASLNLALLIAGILIGLGVVARLLGAHHRCGLTATWEWPVILAVLFAGGSLYVLRHVTYGTISGALLTPTVFTQAPDLPARQAFFSSGGQITALFLAALSALVLPSRGCGDERCLRDRMELLRLVLAVGTVLLVVDVIREDALLQWAVAFVDPSNKTAVATVQSLASTIVAGRGVEGTAFLAAIYLPAAAVLRGWAWGAVPSSITTIPEATTWLQERALVAPSAFAQFRPVVAVLLPLLTGLLTGPAAQVIKGATRM